MVQLSCLIYGLKVKYLKVHSVKCEKLDIIVNTTVNQVTNCNMIKLLALRNI